MCFQESMKKTRSLPCKKCGIHFDRRCLGWNKYSKSNLSYFLSVGSGVNSDYITEKAITIVITVNLCGNILRHNQLK